MSGGNSMMSDSQLKYENERLKLALTHRYNIFIINFNEHFVLNI